MMAHLLLTSEVLGAGYDKPGLRVNITTVYFGAGDLNAAVTSSFSASPLSLVTHIFATLL